MTEASIYDMFPDRRAARAAAQQPTNPGPAAPPPDDGELHPLAVGIRRDWLAKLDTLRRKPWTKGDAWDHNSHVTARKLIELANSTWSGYTRDQARTDYMTHAPRDDVWDEREKCWDQALKYSATGTLPAPTPSPSENAPPTTVIELDPSVVDAFWDARPLLRHIHDFARARLTSPWATLGVTLARIVTATPWQVCLPPIVGTRGSLNLFVGLVGPSGMGKGAASGAATDAITIHDLKTARLASGEAIAHLYKRRLTKTQQENHEDEWHSRACLIDMGEIDRFAAQSQRQGSTLMADLRAAWAGEMLGQVAADPTRSIILEPHEYRLTMVAGIQPYRAAVLLDDEDGGTPQRFIWMPAGDPDAPDNQPDEPEPFPWSPPQPSRFTTMSGTHMTVPTEIQEEIRHNRLLRLRMSNPDPLDGHRDQAKLKIAAALALTEQRMDVTLEDWQLAGVILHKSDHTRATVVADMATRAALDRHQRAEGDATRAVITEDRMIGAAVERVGTVITRKLGRDGGTATHSDMLRAIAGRDRGHYEDAIRHLIDNNKITHTQADDGATTYTLNRDHQ